MMIDWTHFTPLESAIGGVVIGAAASMLILFCGRVAGISGILGGVLSRANNDKGWRIAFLLGMVLSPVLWRLVAPLPAVSITAPWPMLVVAGLLVGVGTRYGSGCTSGHGVCGLSRLSVRSLVATLTFMAAAFITVWLVGFWRG
ncbi:YeeE/YedE family protein [Phytobacter diazotrophicus]|uniref:YeeE/YedE family protein n=1 Tax=Phytobacter diazotrophicus TaxID=395631 RepID=UPI000892B9D1|nr:YeeE/YedE family protein [Phytobacter diazotrophicus]AUU91089.1 YeeE/YedE family protein [Enterobacteriaceae bacterium ENNIH3]AUV08895.1 YeeE/YedE family protein [Enterobacteriaceae bacterium ENNIH2]MDU4998957.1 YeeE/YedE family protein [Enterobacteriaceae bacterium]PWF50478.1 YeeE/YedE family protein [[Kluyvera] intestini]MDV2900325.1 YeeE/YedE family protein [Phytobacter diazotrophicus]